ncbi:MAG TPA: LLM class F420-dependent oxidoreductase [Chloroflexia bacterium]|nr:LLM class F420-dependent oxidoreductase [Chloroflexia bacterium]
MAVKFGVFVPQGWKMDLVGIADPVEQYEAMTRAARAADEAGFDSIWVYDHFHTVPVPTEETTFEAWTITAGLVRDTRRIKVGQMVTCNGYRHPALLAKMASTVDVMSHGRLICGLGAGWYEHEWRAYGYGFPDIPVRMGMFREACEIISRMWTEDAPVFHGQYYTIDQPINIPRGARKPHPEFWLGGGGEKVTLKLVAKWADGCNMGGGNPETLRHKIAVLHEHCTKLGRDPREIAVSTSLEDIHLLAPGADPAQAAAWTRGRVSLAEYQKRYKILTADQLSAQIQGLVDAGATYVLIYLAGLAYNQEMIHHFAQEVMPRFAG